MSMVGRASNFLLLLILVVEAAFALDEIAFRDIDSDSGGGGGGVVHLPIYCGSKNLNVLRKTRRADGMSAIGLGDDEDVTYNVLMQIGNISAPLVLDTGSADLWIISTACTMCNDTLSTSLPMYPIEDLKGADGTITLTYGDSSTATDAVGVIGQDTVSVAGISLEDQYFAAVNDTNASVLDSGSSGIFGLGFPANSVLWKNLYSMNPSVGLDRKSLETLKDKLPQRRSSTSLSSSPSPFSNTFTTLASTQPLDVLSSFSSFGPLLTRLILQTPSTLPSPQFSITLQRDTIQLGGNTGQLSLGGLPDGVLNDSMTWVNVRGYSSSNESGLQGAPGEIYPIAWEIFLDDVFLDGVKLPRSVLGDSDGVQLSALIDTGNSLIRGPADVISHIYTLLNATTPSNASITPSSTSTTTNTNTNTNTNALPEYPCSTAHNLSFQLGGQIFPIDARDFGSQTYTDTVNICTPNIAATDPPQVGGFLYSWSLGTPFLKGVLSSYYFGNITYPSTDPPRIGLLSTVPDNAGALLQDAISSAQTNGDNFPAATESAPSGTAFIAGTDSVGVGQALTVTTTTSFSAAHAPFSTTIGKSTSGSSNANWGVCNIWLCLFWGFVGVGVLSFNALL